MKGLAEDLNENGKKETAGWEQSGFGVYVYEGVAVLRASRFCH